MNNNNDKFVNVTSGVYCPSVDLSKNVIYNENRLKSDIYRWNNLVTNEAYVGYSVF